MYFAAVVGDLKTSSFFSLSQRQFPKLLQFFWTQWNSRALL